MQQASQNEVRAMLRQRSKTPHLAPAAVLTSAPHAVQLNRRASMRLVLGKLVSQGLTGLEEQATYLGLPYGATPTDLRRGGGISGDVAREIEWAMHKRRGWMDEDRRGDILDY